MFSSIADAPASSSWRAVLVQPPSVEPLREAMRGTSTVDAAASTSLR